MRNNDATMIIRVLVENRYPGSPLSKRAPHITYRLFSPEIEGKKKGWQETVAWSQPMGRWNSLTS